MEKFLELPDIGTIWMVKNKRSKRIRLTINAKGEVRISLPWTATFEQARDFAIEKKDWILQAQQKMENKPSSPAPITPEIDFSTRHHKLHLEPYDGEKVRISIGNGKTFVSYPRQYRVENPGIQEHIRFAIDETLRMEAKAYLPLRAGQLAQKFGFKFNRIFIKNNKTNWGSCSSLGNINLNLHLMRLPDRLIDLVIVHELLHTEILNHGPEFKARMRRYFRNHDELDAELKKYSPQNYICSSHTK